VSAPKPEYTVTWREKGKPMRKGPFRDYLVAEQEARALSRQHRTPILIESMERCIHARWEGDTQTLARSVHVPVGSELFKGGGGNDGDPTA
jgi:hypothetical protein